MLGLDLDHLAVDGCITKAPCGGQTAGRSPVDRGKQGLKRSIVTEAAGIPLGAVPAGANPRDDGLRTNFHRQDLGTSVPPPVQRGGPVGGGLDPSRKSRSAVALMSSGPAAASSLARRQAWTSAYSASTWHDRGRSLRRSPCWRPRSSSATTAEQAGMSPPVSSRWRTSTRKSSPRATPVARATALTVASLCHATRWAAAWVIAAAVASPARLVTGSLGLNIP